MYENYLDDLLFDSDGNNLQGICSILAYAKEDVTSMPDIKSIMASPTYTATFPISAITLAPGANIYQIMKDLPIRSRLNMKNKQTQQGGDFWVYSLSFDFPHDRYATSKKLLAFDKREFILHIKFKNHTEIIIGSLDRGCDFSTESDSGNSIQGINKYDAEFRYESAQRHFYITPA